MAVTALHMASVTYFCLSTLLLEVVILPHGTVWPQLGAVISYDNEYKCYCCGRHDCEVKCPVGDGAWR